MDISIHTEVHCLDGLVGKSTHIIVNPVTEQVSHVVLKTKEHDHEYLVSLDMVSSADRDAILLNCKKDDINDLPPYISIYFNGRNTYSGSPPLPVEGMGTSYTLYQPYRTSVKGAEDVSLQPSGQLAIAKGAVVLATDGQVGKVDELVIDPDTHQFTYLVIKKHNLLKELEVTIPVNLIERAEMYSIFLKIDKEAVATLPTVKLKKFHWE